VVIGSVRVFVGSIATFLALGGIAEAQAYRWVDANGTVHYTQIQPPPNAVETPRDLAELVDRVLDRSGAKWSIAQIPAQVQASILQRNVRLSPATLATLSDIMTRAFSAETLYARVRDAFVVQGDPRRLELIFEFLQSPLAKRMTGLELDATSPEGLAEMTQFAERLKTSRPPPVRLALMGKLDAASGATDLSVEVAIAVFRSMANVIDAASPPDQRLKRGELEVIVAKTRAALYDSARMAVSIRLLFTYRAVPDKELSDYVQFYESDPGKWFVQVFRKGFLDAISAAATRGAEEMTRAFTQKTQAGHSPDAAGA